MATDEFGWPIGPGVTDVRCDAAGRLFRHYVVDVPEVGVAAGSELLVRDLAECEMADVIAAAGSIPTELGGVL